MLNGRSTVNRPNCINIAEGIPAPYGGCDATDSSGIMTYTRVEFSGIEFTPNNELNVITLNGVGNGTVIHHIQANAGVRRLHRMVRRDGKRQVHRVVGAAPTTASTGSSARPASRQYGFMIQYGPHLQTGNQSRGIEADNSEFGFDDLPRSNPKFCNVTMIGARDNDVNLGSQGGLFFRRGTAGTVANAIVTNFRGSCINLNDAATARLCLRQFTARRRPPIRSCSSRARSATTTEARERPAPGSKQIDGCHLGHGELHRRRNGTRLITGSKNVTPASGVGTNPQIYTTTQATRWDDFLASGPYPIEDPERDSQDRPPASHRPSIATRSTTPWIPPTTSAPSIRMAAELDGSPGWRLGPLLALDQLRRELRAGTFAGDVDSSSVTGRPEAVVKPPLAVALRTTPSTKDTETCNHSALR